ncbi:DUF6625 family protein [Methylomonas sp. 2BW1-5-20]|uniref:DUF6625 family protein n=1 Tax=Methylomonas sp. 2BW1-5-20 TaxID=3376686 RepID=UPI0040501486
MTTIHLLIPYFGKLPPWFGLFLTSCAANSSVKFTLIGDDASFDPLFPPNVYRIPMNLSEFSNAAADRLGKKISIVSARRVCDFRPMMGAIFSEQLKDAGFWGYCDVDIILGNIRRFLTEELLKSYDVISSGNGCLAGHFVVFRNEGLTQRLFERSKDIDYILSTDNHTAFDELGPSAIWHFPGFTLGTEGALEAMSQVVWVARDSGMLKAHLGLPIVNDPDMPFRKCFNVRWDHGCLTDSKIGCEYLYVHFQSSKGRFGFRRWIPTSTDLLKQFKITQRGFFQTRGLNLVLKSLTCVFHDDIYTKTYRRLFDESNRKVSI